MTSLAETLLDDWVVRAMARWPNVPALFGWLGLDRRGAWLIRGEVIRHPRIIETINRNYAGDEYGRWFFQNGPQRGYIELESAPYILRVSEDAGSLITHTGLAVTRLTAAYLDQEGALLICCEHGPGEILGADLDWALARLRSNGDQVDEESIAAALNLPSGALTPLTLELADTKVRVERLDFDAAPAELGYVRRPAAREGERSAGGAPPD